MKELILGGARSGKSRLAESKALSTFHAALSQQPSARQKMLYVATATAYDDVMADRIRHHQQGRSEHWQLIEEPIELGTILKENNDSQTVILIECLTLWLTNLLCHTDKTLFESKKQEFIQ